MKELFLIREPFGLKHDGNQIFLRGFDGSNPSIVDTTNNSIQIAVTTFT